MHTHRVHVYKSTFMYTCTYAHIYSAYTHPHTHIRKHMYRDRERPAGVQSRVALACTHKYAHTYRDRKRLTGPENRGARMQL